MLKILSNSYENESVLLRKYVKSIIELVLFDKRFMYVYIIKFKLYLIGCSKLVCVSGVWFLAAMDNQLVNEKDVPYFGSVTMLHL